MNRYTGTFWRSFWLLALMLVQSAVFAANVTVGKKLSPLSVTDLGECVLIGEETEFKAWNTGQLKGKVQVVEYVAARAGVDSINKAFYDALEAADFPDGQVGLNVLVNSDDALWGTSGLVAGEIRKNKKAEPEKNLIIDAQGLGLEQWGFKKKGAALTIIDASGTVLFFKEGGLTAEEISKSLALIQQQFTTTP